MIVEVLADAVLFRGHYGVEHTYFSRWTCVDMCEVNTRFDKDCMMCSVDMRRHLDAHNPIVLTRADTYRQESTEVFTAIKQSFLSEAGSLASITIHYIKITVESSTRTLW